MIKCNIKIGDIVHTQIGTGEVVAVSKTKETLMVKMDDDRGVCDKIRVRKRRF